MNLLSRIRALVFPILIVLLAICHIVFSSFLIYDYRLSELEAEIETELEALEIINRYMPVVISLDLIDKKINNNAGVYHVTDQFGDVLLSNDELGFFSQVQDGSGIANVSAGGSTALTQRIALDDTVEVTISKPVGQIIRPLQWSIFSFLLLSSALLAIMTFIERRKLEIERISFSIFANALTSIGENFNVKRRVPAELIAEGPMRNLALRLNELLDVVGRQIDWLGNLSDAIAHELKRPVAYARQHILEAASGKRDEAASLRDAAEELDEALELFEAVLSLSDVNVEEKSLPGTDLRDSILRTVALFQDHAEQAGICLDVDAAPVLTIMTPGHQLQLVTVLVDNAIKYGSAGGIVRISCRQKGQKAVLAVADSGPGPTALPNQAVSRGTRGVSDHRGAGLGLWIAQMIAARYGARLEFSEAPTLGGLLVYCQIPLRV